ncbi:MAG: transposase [Bacteroidetes bacterium]|nr:transposase [Tateyamaria sp.]MBT6367015.1 transposase [Bacteroidota bacterium]
MAKHYGLYGYRKVTTLLRMEGWRVNPKKIEGLLGPRRPATAPAA